VSTKEIMEAVQNCKYNAEKLRAMARAEPNKNLEKLLLEAAHHLDVGTAELEYITTDSTVSI